MSAFALVDLELFRLAGRRQTHVLLIGFGAALLVVFATQHGAIAQDGRGAYGVLGHGRQMLERLGACAIAALVPLVAVCGAGAIAEERERGTLELLLASPLSARGIVVAKLAALMIVTMAAIAMALPSFAAAMAMGGVQSVEVAAVALSTGAVAIVAGALALLASAACRRAGSALVLTVALCGAAWVADLHLVPVVSAWIGLPERALHLVPATTRGTLPPSLFAPNDAARATLGRSIGAWAGLVIGALALAVRLVHSGVGSGWGRAIAQAAATTSSAGNRAADVEPFAKGGSGRARSGSGRVALLAWFFGTLALLPNLLLAEWPRTLLTVGWPIALVALALRGADAVGRHRRAGTLELLLVSPLSSRSFVGWMLASSDGLYGAALRVLVLWVAFGVAQSAAGPMPFAPLVWGWVPLEGVFPLMALVAMRVDLSVARAVGLVVGMRLSPRHARAAIVAGWIALLSSAHVAGALGERWLNPTRLEPWKRSLPVLGIDRPRVVPATGPHAVSVVQRHRRTSPADVAANPRYVHFLVLASHLGFALLAGMGVRLALKHRASELIGRGHAPRARRSARGRASAEAGPTTRDATSAARPESEPAGALSRTAAAKPTATVLPDTEPHDVSRPEPE